MKKLIVGLTGGIGTGKSTALNAFKRLGADTLSLDEVAHRLARKGSSVYRAVVRSFGRKFVGSDGELDRKALAAVVFKRPELRRRLERITHPAILRAMRQVVRRPKRPVTVVDAPLLFEAKLQKEFDVTLLVSASPSIALSRVIRRNGIGRLDASRRMRAQMPIRQKEDLADVVVFNNGSRRSLETKVKDFYRALELIAGI